MRGGRVGAVVRLADERDTLADSEVFAQRFVANRQQQIVTEIACLIDT